MRSSKERKNALNIHQLASRNKPNDTLEKALFKNTYALYRHLRTYATEHLI